MAMISLKNPRNILLIQLGDIGDVILTFPCVRALKETYPEANVVVAVREKASDLVKLCSWAGGIISVAEGTKGIWHSILYYKAFFSNLRHYQFDIAIDMRTGTRGAILAFFSGAQERLSYYAADGKLWRNKVFNKLYKPKVIPNYNIVDYHHDLLNSFNIETNHREPVITIPDHTKEAIEELISKTGIDSGKAMVAIQPFSLWKYKEWGEEKFVKLIQEIVKRYDVSVVITGGPGEKRRAQSIISHFNDKVYSIAGKTTLSLYAAFLEKCFLLISVDSSGPHIAAAVGTPTVTIFGPASPNTWAPRGPKHSTIQKKFPCVPCHKMGCENSNESRCIQELTVQEVKDTVEVLMDKLDTPLS